MSHLRVFAIASLALLATIFLDVVFKTAVAQVQSPPQHAVASDPDKVDVSAILSALGGVGGGGIILGFFLRRLIKGYDEKFEQWEANVTKLAEKWDEKHSELLAKAEQKNSELLRMLNEIQKDLKRIEVEGATQRAQLELQKNIRKIAGTHDVNLMLKEMISLKHEIAQLRSDKKD